MNIIDLENGTRLEHKGMSADVHTYDQYVTVYAGDRAVGTLTRRRHNELGGNWKMHTTDGGLVGENNRVAILMRQLAAKLGL